MTASDDGGGDDGGPDHEEADHEEADHQEADHQEADHQEADHEGDDATGPLTVAWRRSWLLGRVRSVSGGFRAAASTSRTMAVLEGGRWLATTSGLYRWFAADRPAGRVVVDVGGSRFAGPVVRRASLATAATVRAWRYASTKRVASTLADALRDAPVRATGAFVLCLVVASLVATLYRPTPIGAGPLAMLAGLAVLGLRDGRSREELAEGPVGGRLVAILAPPTGGSQR